MMSPNNENYVNNVNGATFTSGISPGRGAPKDSQVVIQRNPYGVRVLGRGARSKNKRQSPPASPSGSFTNVPGTHVKRRIEAAQSIRTRDNVAHSRVNHHQLLLGNKNILTGKKLDMVEKANEYHLDIIGVFQPNDVALELWIWMADGNSSIWCWSYYLNSSGCGDSHKPPVVRLCFRLDFFGIAGLYVEARSFESVFMPIAGICTQCYEWSQAFANEINLALLRESPTESIVLWRILTLKLEQTQIHGRVWS